MKNLKLIGGGIALVVFALVMVPPFLKERKQKAAHDEQFAPVAARLGSLVDEYLAVDLRSLKTSSAEDLRGRKALLVDLEGKRLLPLQQELDDEQAPKRAEEVGLVVYYRSVADAKPAFEFEGGGKSFGATLFLLAVSHPEKKVVGSLKKRFPAPAHTLGVKILGSTSSADVVAPIPPREVQSFVSSLVTRRGS